MVAQQKEAPEIVGADALLKIYLDAVDQPAAEAALRKLVEEEAAPVIDRVVSRKARDHGESEEVTSAARVLMLGQLMGLRRGQRDLPIRNFRAYAAKLTYSAWAEYLRRKNPQRALLLNRLHYLLENKMPPTRFALWESDGVKWCGLVKWKARVGLTTPKLQWLLSDSAAAGREVFRGIGLTNNLAETVARLFAWLETPIELHDLVRVIAEFLQISDRAAPIEAADEIASAQVSPSEELAWKEYLRWLWRTLEQLSAPQCAAFILHAEVLGDFEAHGLASIRTIAPRIGFTPEKLATLWRDLPLDDLRIAAELKCTRQQVINLRRVARDKLGKAWADFAKTGNKPRVFASLFL